YQINSKKPLYELKLTSMPLKIITSPVSKVALVLYWSGKQVDIINLEDETILTKIDIDANASDAVLNTKDNIAYVSSQNANAIYAINLNSMELERVIKVEQKPSLLSYSELDGTVAFFDAYLSRIYALVQAGQDYTVQAVGEVKNVSKVLSDTANIYALSRTDSMLYVYDKVQAKLISSISIDKKPTDAVMIGTKIYILCSKEGYMDVYDTVEGKVISRTQLSKDGFYSNIALLPNGKNIVITGLNTKNYLIYNLETMKLTKKQDSYIDVANIMIVDKAQAL
ncbi:hypothetical protein IJ670_03685, partial [bacterium]|nr:hypothetical protein [bacterium]